ncbi:hypothetical protein A0H76_2294 [Hepatospora eriocheir]|uniref:Peptidase M48 domain-containing protein n=1 Tax=Hepatospora eriocheir TaxID=1081669 RepID=A0A1X0QJY3_9MICR|nr:hypothetical protein A0H76_2294 [Hepatospora eriocheir]
MKLKYSHIIYLSFLVSISILFYEFFSITYFHKHLIDKTKGLKNNSATKKLANKDKEYIPSQRKATKSRARKVKGEIFSMIGLGILAYIFFNVRIRSKLMHLCDRRLTIIPTDSDVVERKELNFVCLFITLSLAIIYKNNLFSIFGIEVSGPLFNITCYIFLFSILLPFLIILIYNLMTIFRVNIIFAFYLAFIIKGCCEFFIQEDIDLSEFKKVNIKEFSPKVVDFLKSRGLENSVYKEKKPSDSINAALVGWGEYEHIEIYGDHNDFTNKEFESVLMHEIGHSKDYSLFKKAIVLLLMKLAELATVTFIFLKLPRGYKDEHMSDIGCFLILLKLYSALINRYYSVFHKLSSQNAEINADLIAKRQGFGIELGKVLFSITIHSNELLKSTWLYNAFSSYHPTIYSRVEYLSS